MAITAFGVRRETSVPGSPGKSTDIDWLVPFAIIVALEVLVARTLEMAATYSLIALIGSSILAVIWLLFWMVRSARKREEHPMSALTGLLWNNRIRLLSTVIGIELTAFGMSAFSALKARIPGAVPFYADEGLSNLDVWLIGQDAWSWIGQHFGVVAYPVSVIYGLWLPTHFLVFTALVLSKPSPVKSQAIIAFGLMWLFLGVCLAYALSSVGPIFYDRLYGGDRYAGLIASIQPLYGVSETADYLWGRYVAGDVSFGRGISAMPSLHVAGTLWLALVIRRAVPRVAFLGWAYLAIIYVGSVMLGWHYITDGLVGMAGTVLVWRLAGQISGWRHRPAWGRLVTQAKLKG